MNATSIMECEWMIVKTLSYFVPPIQVVFGVFLNLFTIMVFCRRKLLKYSISVSMISLALADIIVLTIPIFITWYDEHKNEFKFLTSTIWCSLHGYIDLVFCATSAWITVLISIERWFAVCMPWKKSTYFTKQRVLKAILIAFITAIFGFSYFPFTIQRIHDNGEYNCVKTSDRLYFIFGTISITLVYIIPFIVLAILNSKIIIRLKMRPFSTRRLKGVSCLHPLGYDKSDKNEQSERTKSLQSDSQDNSISNTHTTSINMDQFQVVNSINERNLSVTLVAVAITYMILTFPHQITWLYSIFVEFFYQTETECEREQRRRINEIAFFFRNMNYVVNFFLYSALSKLFRKELCHVLLKNKFYFLRIVCFFCFKNLEDQKPGGNFSSYKESRSAVTRSQIIRVYSTSSAFNRSKFKSTDFSMHNFDSKRPSHADISNDHRMENKTSLATQTKLTAIKCRKCLSPSDIPIFNDGTSNGFEEKHLKVKVSTNV